jgi:cytochrome c oxidase accessory protein FixG
MQSVLLDRESLIVGYDKPRGEPRGRRRAAAKAARTTVDDRDPQSDRKPGCDHDAATGSCGGGCKGGCGSKKETPAVDAPAIAFDRDRTADCIDCTLCVQTCPTGIDIRDGLQLECIHCAQCIDACDAVMDKVGRPRGLVRYDSSKGLAGGKTRWVRPRTLFYTALLLLGATVMSVGFSTFRPVTVTLVRMTGAPYYLDETGGVRNQFMLRAINKRNAAAAFRVEFVGAPEGLQFSGWETPVAVPPLEEQVSPLVITLPRAAFRREIPLRVRVVDAEGRVAAEKTVPFLGPSLP